MPAACASFAEDGTASGGCQRRLLPSKGRRVWQASDEGGSALIEACRHADTPSVERGSLALTVQIGIGVDIGQHACVVDFERRDLSGFEDATCTDVAIERR